MSHDNLDNRYMEFQLGGQLFAMPLMSVKEVIQKPEITSVPNMPSHFEGMMNLRGQILGVFDVRKKLAVKAREKNSENTPEVIIVIEDQGVSVGMLVDEVTKVLHTNEGMIKPAPIKEDDQASSFIRSVIHAGEEMVLAVDVRNLLEIEKYKNKLSA
jgi:purine-binding chemotaxis protein CheW